MAETNPPVFSIITPTDRRPELLKRAINSVKSQTFSDYEHIIIDDANDPDTKIIVDKYTDEKIIFRQHTIQKGAAGAYNTGIGLANGKFIMFLDDDDEYFPTLLEKVFQYFSTIEPNIGFLWTGIMMIMDTDYGEKNIYTKIWPSGFNSVEDGLIEATTIGNGYGLCVRKECIDKIGLYDESFTMGHDADFLFRLASLYDFTVIPEALVKIHQHNSTQLTSKRNNLERLEIREKILKKHHKLLNKYPKLYNTHYKFVADLSYSLGNKFEGRRIMHDIIKRSPFNFHNMIDFLLYEITGKNASSIYRSQKLEKLRRFLKLKSKYLQEY